MRGVKIEYGSVAEGAKNGFNPFIEGIANYSNQPTILKEENLDFPKYSNPCELYSTLLDGSALPLPSDETGSNIGVWSDSITNDDGSFSSPIILNLNANELYASNGITLVFDEANFIFCNDLKITWYRDNVILSEKTFNPDSPFYFCKNKVEFYNGVVIEFYGMNMPKNRLKIKEMEYGERITFYGEELLNITVSQEINSVSAEIPISTCDFAIRSKRSADYSFKAKQTIKVYFDDELKASAFVRKATRSGQNSWSIQAEDYIGLMESVPFYGGIYNNSFAVDIIHDIFTSAKIPFEISEDFDDETVTGYIPFTNCRKALMQVAFAIGAIVDTSNSRSVKIYKRNDQLTQKITKERIGQDQRIEEKTIITSVELAAHSYRKTNEEKTIYDSSESGTGSNIFVKFSEPMHSLVIKNGILIDLGDNYAIIDAQEGCVLVGKTYEHSRTVKRKNNPLTLESDIENVISINDATLVSSQNLDKILDSCYNYYVNKKGIKAKIIEGKHESEDSVIYDQKTNIGEVVLIETDYMGDVDGRIEKQTFNLNGNIIVKDSVIV